MAIVPVRGKEVLPMTIRPRPVRVAVSGAQVQFAHTVGELVNVSCTGALIRASYELPPGGEWPLVLELRSEAVRLNARIVRCESTETVLPGSARLRTQYALAVLFIQPSAEARQALEEVCGTGLEPEKRADWETAPPRGRHVSTNAEARMAFVLVVDDEENVREVLARRLRSWGHTVVAVGSADAAIEQMAAAPAEIILCDVIMPIHDGLWLLEQVREKWPNTVVIIVSGAEDVRTVMKARELGALDYVSKPIGREMLYQALQRALAVIASRES